MTPCSFGLVYLIFSNCLYQQIHCNKYSICHFCQVKLCGHATLAAAQTLFTSGNIDSDFIEFDTLSGILTAKKVPDDSNIRDGHEAHKGFFIQLNFPADPSTGFNSVDNSLISKAFGGVSVIDVKMTTNLGYLIVIPPTTHFSFYTVLPVFFLLCSNSRSLNSSRL